MRFKIDWASLIVGMKFTVFSLFCFVFEGNFQVQAPGGAYIRRGDLMEGFLRYEIGGLIFGILRYIILKIVSFYSTYQNSLRLRFFSNLVVPQQRREHFFVLTNYNVSYSPSM